MIKEDLFYKLIRKIWLLNISIEIFIINFYFKPWNFL